MSQITAEAILEALRTIKDPQTNSDVVSLGMVQGLVAKEGHVTFALEVYPAEANAREPLRQACEPPVTA